MDNDAKSSENSEQGPSELQLLKTRATMLGLTFSNNIGLEALKAKIQAKIDGEPEEPEVVEPNPLVSTDDAVAPKVETVQEMRNRMRLEQLKLVRCRITNMDPKKANLPGEIICVGNEILGTIRKFIPFGEQTDEGFHIPYILYQELESRRFLHIRVTKDKVTRQPKTETSWAKEFAIEVLPQLTEQELKDLAIAQAAAGSVGAPNTGAL